MIQLEAVEFCQSLNKQKWAAVVEGQVGQNRIDDLKPKKCIEFTGDSW